MSGLPSAVLGTGAVRFGLPSGSRGTPAVGCLHCAAGGALMKNAARIIQRALIAILQLLTIRDLSGVYYRGNILHTTEILLDSDRAKNRGGFHDATGLDDRNCRYSVWTSRCRLAQWATSRAGSHFV